MSQLARNRESLSGIATTRHRVEYTIANKRNIDRQYKLIEVELRDRHAVNTDSC